jgi:hypothetical protein
VGDEAMLVYATNATGRRLDLALDGHDLRMLGRTRGGTAASDNPGETWNQPGWFINVQGVVVLVVSVRFCYFFRGNLQLGALTHTFFNIIIDILPMLAFLGVIIFGFTFALMILIMHELDNTYYGQWHSIDKALYVVLNMGLYAQTDPVAVKIERSSTVLLLLYQLFMFVVQVGVTTLWVGSHGV